MFSLKWKVNNLVNMNIFGHICATSTATGQEICLECSKSAFCLRPLAAIVQQMWFCEGRCSPLSSRWLHHHTGSGLAPTLTLGRQARTVAGTLNFQCNLHTLVGVILELSDETDIVFLSLAVCYGKNITDLNAKEIQGHTVLMTLWKTVNSFP